MIKTCPECKTVNFHLVIDFTHPNGTHQDKWVCDNCNFIQVNWDGVVF